MLKFYRMHGLGNKFVIYDLRDGIVDLENLDNYLQKNNLLESDYDQKIILSETKQADVLMDIYNIDGSTSSACGNATRCVARIIAKETGKSLINIQTNNRILPATKISETDFQINMGKVLLAWQDIPLAKECDPQNLDLLSKKISKTEINSGFALNIGNPHIIFFAQDIDKISLQDDISWIENDPLFSEGVNINIAQIIDKNNIKLKVWERGAGATLACGTGASATAYAAYRQNMANKNVNILLPGGNLQITITDDDEILMIGATCLQEYCDI